MNLKPHGFKHLPSVLVSKYLLWPTTFSACAPKFQFEPPLCSYNKRKQKNSLGSGDGFISVSCLLLARSPSRSAIDSNPVIQTQFGEKKKKKKSCHCLLLRHHKPKKTNWRGSLRWSWWVSGVATSQFHGSITNRLNSQCYWRRFLTRTGLPNWSLNVQ